MGRNRKPVADHVRDGTYRKDRHGPLPGPAEAFSAPAKPDGMSVTASQFWDAVTKLLAGVVRDRDGPQLVQMCSWWALWQEAEAALMDAEIGTIEYSRTLHAATLASQNFDRIAKRFGLTPQDRGTLRPEKDAPKKHTVPNRPKDLL